MMILKCTDKVRKALRLSDQNLAHSTTANTSPNNWIVHRFAVGRSQFFLFMNEMTLLSFVLYKGKVPITAETMPAMLMGGVSQLLTMKGVNQADIARLLDQFNIGLYAKTDSRRVLGYMNEIIHTYRHFIESEGGLSSCNLTGIIMRINDLRQNMLDWRSPWQATVAILATMERAVGTVQ